MLAITLCGCGSSNADATVDLMKELPQTEEVFGLSVNEDYYNADLYKATFDASTLQDINDWVEEH